MMSKEKIVVSAGGEQIELFPSDRTLEEFSDCELQSLDVRLEHLPPEMINGPSGRGRRTASSRGYDTERLIAKITDGTTDNTESWYDVISSYPCDSEFFEKDHVELWECKSCVDKHPCGDGGSFRIWRRNHEKLIDPKKWFVRDRHFNREKSLFDPRSRYLFLIYTVVEDQPVEVGKIGVDPEWIDALIDDWQFMRHDTMGYAEFVDVTWTTLLDNLNIHIYSLQSAEIVYPWVSDAPKESTTEFENSAKIKPETGSKLA